MENGLHLNVHEANYHALDRLSWSKVKHALTCPAKALYEQTRKREPSDAMIMGSLVDVLTFTPDTFDDLFVVGIEKPSGRAGSVLAALEAIDTEIEVVEGKSVPRAVAAAAKEAGRIACTQADVDEARAYIEAVGRRTGITQETLDLAETGVEAAHAELNRVFGGEWQSYAIPQPTVLTTQRGVDVKCRFDLVVPNPIDGSAAIVDMKITSRLDDFGRHALKYGWFGQLANYAQAWESIHGEGSVSSVYLLAIQLEPWLEAACLPLDERTRGIAESRCNLAWERYLNAQETGLWGGYTDGLTAWSAPKWVK